MNGFLDSGSVADDAVLVGSQSAGASVEQSRLVREIEFFNRRSGESFRLKAMYPNSSLSQVVSQHLLFIAKVCVRSWSDLWLDDQGRIVFLCEGVPLWTGYEVSA